MNSDDKDISLELLRLLSTLYRTHSLSEAAARGGLSLSTAGRKLREARVMFGDELFTRSGQLMFPTAQMDDLIGRVDHLIGEVSSLFNRGAFDPAQTERTIRIAALDGAYTLLIAPVIERVRKSAPGIHFSIVPITITTFDDLKAGVLDLLLYGSDQEPVNDAVEMLPLIHTGFSLVMREGHPLAALYREKGRFEKKDLAPWPMIALQTPYSLSRPTATLPWFEDADLYTEVMLPYHFSIAMQLLESDAIAENSAPFGWYLEEHIPGLVSLPFDGFTKYRWTPTLFWHRRLHADPVIQWFRSLVKCEAEALNERYLASRAAKA